jgi:hypothetical protein
MHITAHMSLIKYKLMNLHIQKWGTNKVLSSTLTITVQNNQKQKITLMSGGINKLHNPSEQVLFNIIWHCRYIEGEYIKN